MAYMAIYGQSIDNLRQIVVEKMPIKFNDEQSHSQPIERQLVNTFIDRNKIQLDARKYVN